LALCPIKPTNRGSPLLGGIA
jgi:hypothetical protein